ncbi:hypothetical protein Tco_0366220 [Tanacetum coccineum]
MAKKATTSSLNSFGVLSTLVDEEEGEVTNKASASKPSTSMGDQLVKSDEDEVELPNDETSRYMSSTGGGGF